MVSLGTLQDTVEASSSLQLWGGVECTINRVDDSYLNQLAHSCHTTRLSDFNEFAALGIRALRQPVLWEWVHGEAHGEPNWTWTDQALARLRELNIAPIVGLIHHGSGPKHTGLLDPQFPEKLAVFAREVAERYPWVDEYTPVNEPLTTARFSALYGHWYPHKKDDGSFAHALLNQIKAVVLAMRAVRQVNPRARLVQTDDLGKIFSTPRLAYQAEFENERRWLAFDLLLGRVDRTHPTWMYLLWAGVLQHEIEWFLDNPCPPDIIGINHYLSGERFLDEHLERYPEYTHGGNGRDRYADVLASRVLQSGAAGPGALLMEAWHRFKVPVAVTECHNGCTREEQLRWLLEVWRSAENARQQGADIRAVTMWSLLGAFDWGTLVTQANKNYEPGPFDIRSPQPRMTAVAKLGKHLAASRELKTPLLQVPGWWRRKERFVYGFSLDNEGMARPVDCPSDAELDDFCHLPPVLITGGHGTLARAFSRICRVRGIPYRVLSRAEMDIADLHSVRHALFRHHPWAVINAAGYVRVDDAEGEPEKCHRENVEGAVLLAKECRDRGIPLLTFSSDLVFDGTSSRPYLESDPVNPLNNYGRSKAEAERRVLEICPQALVVRTSAFFGPWDEYNFVTIALRNLASGEPFTAAQDAIVSPTYVPDLVNHCLDLVIDEETGIWHLANQGEITWADLALRAAEIVGIDSDSLRPRPVSEMGYIAPRPKYSALSSERGWIMPSLESALQRYAREVEFFSKPELMLAA
jgi:dTDP-4-dehydrorhamnose reductase